MPAHRTAALLAFLAGAVAAQEDRSAMDLVPFGQTGAWSVAALTAGEVYGACEASRDDGLTLARDPDGWSLAMPFTEEGIEAAGFVSLGVADTPVTWQAAAGLAAARLPDGWTQGLGDSGLLRTRIGEAPEEDWPLAGAAAAAALVDACYAKHGVAAAKVPAEAAPEPAPEPAPESAPESAAEAPQASVPAQPSDDASRLGAGCPAWGEYVSGPPATPVQVTFVNAADREIGLFRIGPDGTIAKMAGLLPGDSALVDTYAEHYWLAKDADAVCLLGVIVPTDGAVFDLR